MPRTLTIPPPGLSHVDDHAPVNGEDTVAVVDLKGATGGFATLLLRGDDNTGHILPDATADEIRDEILSQSAFLEFTGDTPPLANRVLVEVGAGPIWTITLRRLNLTVAMGSETALTGGTDDPTCDTDLGVNGDVGYGQGATWIDTVGTDTWTQFAPDAYQPQWLKGNAAIVRTPLGDNVDADGFTILNLAYPPVSDGDAAGKKYVDLATTIVRDLDGRSPNADVGTFAFQLDQVIPPTGGEVVISIALADGSFDVHIPADVADDGAMADVWEAALPGKIAFTNGFGAATFAEGRSFLIGILTGHGSLPIAFGQETFLDSTTGGAVQDPPITVDSSDPGGEQVAGTTLLLDRSGKLLYAMDTGTWVLVVDYNAA